MGNQIKSKIYLSSPHMGIMEQGYISEAFDTNWISPLGPNVDSFESELAEYVGARGAVALSSGTAAIHLALRLLEVGPGDQVLCSSLTFVASANPILYQGAEPVYVDSEPETWNMSPIALRKALFELQKMGMKPKAVIVVNLYGQSADMAKLIDICTEFDVPVIEDAAESLGATYRGKASGTFGKFGIYSFNGNKIITTSGGGMLVSDDLDALNQARFMATQARDKAIHYQHSQLGYNYRLSNVLAGIGRGQLKVLDDRVAARRTVFQRYFEALAGFDGVEFMPEPSNHYFSTRWLTALTIDPSKCNTDSKEIIDALALENIEARPVWKPLHLQPLFEGNKYYTHYDTTGVSDQLFANGICIPSGSNLSMSDQQRVIDCIIEILNR